MLDPVICSGDINFYERELIKISIVRLCEKCRDQTETIIFNAKDMKVRAVIKNGNRIHNCGVANVNGTGTETNSQSVNTANVPICCCSLWFGEVASNFQP